MALPDPATLLTRTALYESFEVQNVFADDSMSRLVRFAGSIDMYCIDCERSSVFVAQQGLTEGPKSDPRRFPGSKILICTRNHTHQAVFNFFFNGTTVTKTGQYPSAADLQIPDIEKYKSIIKKEQRSELVKGLGLAAHGIGIGAFVYLRRVFENQVEEARLRASVNADWNEDRYRAARMDEKIKILEDHLPTFLVQNRRLYGILSKGVHELSEAECIKAFPTVKGGLELILDERLAAKILEEKQRRLAAEISEFGSN